MRILAILSYFVQSRDQLLSPKLFLFVEENKQIYVKYPTANTTGE